MLVGEIPHFHSFSIHFPHISHIPVTFQSHSKHSKHSKEQVRQEQREKHLEEKKSPTAVEFLVFVQFLGLFHLET